MSKDNLLDDTPEHLLNCSLSAKFDVIAYEFCIYNNSFALPENLTGYKRRKKPFFVKGKTHFQPDWGVHKYKNLKTGNLVYFAISSRIMKSEQIFFRGYSRKVKKPQYLVRIFFHGEKTPLTAKEINDFLSMVVKAYGRFLNRMDKASVTDKRILDMPYPSLYVAEVAVDFKGPCVYYLYEDFSNNLYRMRSVKRKKYAGEDIDSEEVEETDSKKKKGKDPKYTYGDRVLYKHLQTSYISDSYRDYTFDVIKKKPKKKDEKKKDKRAEEVLNYFRFEMILRKRYLQNEKILTVEDLERKLDWVKYWTDNFFFFKFDEKKIRAYVTKNYPKLLMPILLLSAPNRLYTPHQSYEKLRTYTAKVKGKEKRVFNYPSRQLITTKWHRLDRMIQDALRTLSLSGIPADRQIRTRQRDLERMKPDRRRNRKQKEVMDAVASLKKRGIESSDLPVREFAREAGISPKTAQEYKDLWKK